MRTKSKSKSRRSLKGGSPQPYVYEGVELKEGNDLIQLAVTRMDDGTYTFNPIGQNFSSYCDLAKYYCSKNSLACVNSSIPTKTEGETLMYPSLIQLLGLSLLLAHAHNVGTELYTAITVEELSKTFLRAIITLKENPILFKSIGTGCVSSISSYNSVSTDFFKISSLAEDDVKTILTIMKKLMFYSKYLMVPDNFINQLTFSKILESATTNAKVHVLDTKEFDEKIKSENFRLHKTTMFTPTQLKASQLSSASQPSSAVPASSAPMASLEDRVATLEREVAELKKAVAR